ncbi:hypothetical protein IOD16_26920 [Saccharothrix sp. 6-C]|uniref:Uncharacterized protein n=1 Tax=Saccharothrix texasensis TaxID=103734 RepID=A0A3N1HF76_9PSEU|nr:MULTISPECIES: hypothetical protein [Saccharothrix]QQQ74749.1 hypothetical protein IOD16_26920 [Saccharothrix sp. 6-C]ROP41158.1 hypothetical protein EDD40_6584 [Saccharothrix texasensis]
MRSLGPRMEVAVAMTILGVGAAVVTAMHLTWPEPELPAMAYSISGGEVSELEPFGITDISGGAVELTPGSEGARTVRLSNPNNVEIVVLTLEAQPGQPLDAAHNRVPGCPSAVLSVAPMAEPVTIPPAGAVDVAMVVRIAHDVPNACTDLVFPLTYSGRAART